jgi:hypothetical protein
MTRRRVTVKLNAVAKESNIYAIIDFDDITGCLREKESGVSKWLFVSYGLIIAIALSISCTPLPVTETLTVVNPPETITQPGETITHYTAGYVITVTSSVTFPPITVTSVIPGSNNSIITTITSPPVTSYLPGPTTTVTATITTAPPFTLSDPWAPTLQQLEKGNYSLPYIARISVQKAYDLLNSSNVPVFVDVRSRDLYNIEHVPGARNMPNTPAVTTPGATNDPLFTLWKALPIDKLIIFYCD